MLITQYELEAEAAKKTLNDWTKARSISMQEGNVTTNDELIDKIQRLEKGKRDVEKFVQDTEERLKSTDASLDEVANELLRSHASFALLLNETRSLLNYKYTVIQKNDINRRITAINSSRILNNADMEELQHLWTSILGTTNDKRLIASKEAFELRLKDWENLIEQKKKNAG